jgi:hypothetical protein
MNKGLVKLNKINAEAKVIREKAGFTIVTPEPVRKYKMLQKEAISIASDRLYNKNRSVAVDGVKKKMKTKSKPKAKTKKKVVSKKAKKVASKKK